MVLGLLASLLGPCSRADASVGLDLAVVPGDVPTYLYGLDRTGFAGAETAITGQSASTLVERTQLSIGQSHGNLYGTRAYYNTIISAQPVVVGGRIFWGSWDGYEHASSTADGHTIWRTQIGREAKADCEPPVLGVASTPALAQATIAGVRRYALFVGGGDGAIYALDAGNGAVLWRTPLGSPKQGYFLWSSPAAYQNSIYMGVASIGNCPNVLGSVVKLEAATGKVQATYDVAPPGCLYGGVWGSIAIDTSAGTLYFGTGNVSGPGCSEEVVELRVGDLSRVGRWQIPQAQRVPDGDFGSTPTLFTAVIGDVRRRLLGLANKNGIYYALERDRLGAGPVWETPRLSVDEDTKAPSAWDGAYLYVAASAPTPDHSCTGNKGTLHALDPATGKVIWDDCLFGGPAFAAVTAAPGVVFAAIGSHLYALNPRNGHEYFSYQAPDFNWFYAPPIVAHGVLFAANSDGRILAFTPRGSAGR
jgi:polyvinyl alcohol dehydrogenase (cytochrome)